MLSRKVAPGLGELQGKVRKALEARLRLRSGALGLVLAWGGSGQFCLLLLEPDVEKVTALRRRGFRCLF